MLIQSEIMYLYIMIMVAILATNLANYYYVGININLPAYNII